MVKVSMAELQADLPNLLETARGGEDVVIFSEGEPVARLDPLPQTRRLPAWDPSRQTFAERVADVQAAYALEAPKMSEAEIQAEWDILRGRD